MLDDTKIVDPTDMTSEVYGMVGDMEEALKKRIKVKGEFQNIIFCGMGGSAIGGEIIADCGFDESKIPIAVMDFPEIPAWVNKKTLAIIISYSGNTKETIEMYDLVSAKKAFCVVVSVGGELRTLAKEREDLFLKLKPGMQPRSAIGQMLGIIANIIESSGGPKMKSDMKSMVGHMKKLRNSLSDKSNPNNLSYSIAKKMGNKVPIIYSTSYLSASAVRWKTQINENSKMIAFVSTVPEVNHNEIEAWVDEERRSYCVPVILYEEKMSKDMKESIDTSISVMRSKGVKPIIVNIKGKTVMERSLRAVMIGDYVSLYLAYTSGVDPAEITSIVDFKKRLSLIFSRGKQKKESQEKQKKESRGKRRKKK